VFPAGATEGWAFIGIHKISSSTAMSMGMSMPSDHFLIQLQPISHDLLADTATSGFVSVDYSPSGAIEIAGDHDWFRVQLTSGVRYTFNLTGDTIGASSPALQDPSLKLFDSSSQLIASDDSGGNPNSEIVYTPTNSGTYYVDAGALGDAYTGSYRLSVAAFDTRSDILWQNTDGRASIWDMSGNILIGGGAVSPNPGPNWKAIGTGDFNDDGHSDILWQNAATDQISIWEMNGNTLIGGGRVSSVQGPSGRAVGTGDFNNDGRSDILWQNANGQASIWEMDGNSLIDGEVVGPDPGPSWKAIGTGDFNQDNLSDILWQNTSTGQVSIWEFNGDAIVGGGAVTPNPGPSWEAIGTGDFNQDHQSDILFQNKTTGRVSVWEMADNILIGGGPVSANPGPSWRVIGSDGGSDILLQNTSGQTSIWEMNGNTIVAGGSVSPNPGPNWHAIGLT
jgi:hypothetical protein